MKITRPTYHQAESNLNKRRFVDDLDKLINGRNISYGHTVDGGDQNIDGKMIDVPDTGLANTQFTVTHNLGRVTLFFDVKFKNLAGDVFASASATTTQAFFKATTAHMHVRLFIH